MSEIVDAVTYLETASFVTGAILQVDAGVLLDITDDTADHYSGCKGRGGYGADQRVDQQRQLWPGDYRQGVEHE
ncbi:MAG TPA: hypothetical protein VKR22_07680 [Acidimicrobiales bacterium]|nr:hypothetical protein [Acidimicrobiales bacterium]